MVEVLALLSFRVRVFDNRGIIKGSKLRKLKSILGLTLTFLTLTAAKISAATTPYESKVFNASSLAELAQDDSLNQTSPKRLNIALALHGTGRTTLILEKTSSQPANKSTITYRGIRLVPHNGSGKTLGRRNVDWASATLSQEDDGRFILFSFVTTNSDGFSRFYRGTIKVGETTAKISSTPQFFLASKSCENNDLKTSALKSGVNNQLTAELTSTQWTQLKELQLGLYIDSFAVGKLGSRTISKSTEAVNAVSAIYERDLGIKVTLASTFAEPANSTSAFFETNSSALLESFRDELNQNKRLSSADVSFLYTGRDIDSNIIGLAFLDSVCAAPTYSYGLFQRVSDSLDYIILAHELGHTLSAEHEKSGIMAASLSENAPTNFSDKSKQEISTFIESSGKCLDTIDNSPKPTPTPSIPQPTFNTSGTPTTTQAPKIAISGGIKGTSLSVIATVSAINSGCKLGIRLAKNRQSILTATPSSVYSFSTLQTKISAAANMRTRDAREIFLAVENSCPSSTTTLSNILRIRTSSISARASYTSRDFLRRLRFRFSPVIN